VEEFKYLGTNLTNQNSVYEESRLKAGNAWCHFVQKIYTKFAIQKYKVLYIHGYNFACCFVIFICHELGLNRPVLGPYNNYFIGLPRHHPFGL
jgi:hypothetical protein